MARMAKLLRQLPSPVEGPPTYWFWIDTLCCPISLAEKSIALQRITTVYREAAHVLVLDKSISSHQAKSESAADVAETCLRVFASATWMRRLWTLQGEYGPTPRRLEDACFMI